MIKEIIKSLKKYYFPILYLLFFIEISSFAENLFNGLGLSFVVSTILILIFICRIRIIPKNIIIGFMMLTAYTILMSLIGEDWKNCIITLGNVAALFLLIGYSRSHGPAPPGHGKTPPLGPVPPGKNSGRWPALQRLARPDTPHPPLHTPQPSTLPGRRRGLKSQSKKIHSFFLKKADKALLFVFFLVAQGIFPPAGRFGRLLGLGRFRPLYGQLAWGLPGPGACGSCLCLGFVHQPLGLFHCPLGCRHRGLLFLLRFFDLGILLLGGQLQGGVVRHQLLQLFHQVVPLRGGLHGLAQHPVFPLQPLDLPPEGFHLGHLLGLLAQGGILVLQGGGLLPQGGHLLGGFLQSGVLPLQGFDPGTGFRVGAVLQHIVPLFLPDFRFHFQLVHPVLKLLAPLAVFLGVVAVAQCHGEGCSLPGDIGGGKLHFQHHFPHFPCQGLHILIAFLRDQPADHPVDLQPHPPFLHVELILSQSCGRFRANLQTYYIAKPPFREELFMRNSQKCLSGRYRRPFLPIFYCIHPPGVLSYLRKKAALPQASGKFCREYTNIPPQLGALLRLFFPSF